MGLETLRREMGAFVASTLAMGLQSGTDSLEAESPHRTPVVLVHGLFGSVTNFHALRRTLDAAGVRRFVSFSYGPRIDYQRLASELGDRIAAVCERTGASEVDVVGHSLGGLVGRYLVEHGDGARVRRLVSLGSPWYGHRFPTRELVLFGSDDWLIPAPDPVRVRGGAMEVVAGCGHLNLLYHPPVLERVAAFLTAPLRRLRLPVGGGARRAA